MFLDTDERLIVVEQRRIGDISQDGKRALRDIGIRTILSVGTVSWHAIEPEPGVYRWDDLDRYVEETRAAGLKMLLATYCMPPMWVPGTFYLDQVVIEPCWNERESWLDPLHSEAMELEEEFLRQLMCRYQGQSDICFYYGMAGTGEPLMPPGRMGCTEEQAVEIVGRRQLIFAGHNTDLWTSFHPAMIPSKVGNEHCEAVYSALKSAFPFHAHHRILWTFFTCAGCQWQLDGGLVRYWVGAEYADNVVTNAGRLDRWGAWGMVMSPSPHRGPAVIDARVLEETRKALDILGQGVE